MTVLSGDVVIAGLGPSGRSLAYRCAQRGLRVVAVDPHPQRVWKPTYAAWADELPCWLAPHALAAVVPAPSAFGTREWEIPRTYVVFDSEGLQRSLSVAHCTVVAGRVRRIRPGVAELADGTHLYGRVVVDARGLNARGGPEQTAYGVTVPMHEAEPVLEGRSAWFMDWRPFDAGPAGAGGGAPSFLYAVPVGKDRVLLEETCLAGQPPLPLSELRTRLNVRLARHGVRIDGTEPVERVRFAVYGGPPHRSRQGVLEVGARGGVLHPASGYSVAASLAIADSLADAIAFRDNPVAALWPVRARLVHGLRARGLASFLRMPTEHVPRFFDAFFALPGPLQRAYLSGRSDLPGLVKAMVQIFGDVPSAHRKALIAGVLSPRFPIS